MEKSPLQPNQAEIAGKRKPRWLFSWHGFITVLSVIFILYCVIYVVDLLPTVFGVSISGPQHEGVFLGVVLFFIFLILPGRRKLAKTKKPQWYDILPAVLSLVPTFYFAIFYESRISEEAGFVTPTNVIFGWLLILLILEAARRALGWVFTGLIALFLLYLLTGSHFPGFAKTDSFRIAKVGEFMYISRDGIFGIPITTASKIIVIYLFFAQLLFVCGAGDWFVNLANAIAGHVRGGPAKASILASAGFGTMSSSVAGNVATTGVVTIPLMKKVGFRPAFAGAVEAVASTGGQIMPPVMGSVVFVLCEFIGMPYWQVVIYSFIPAVLYYVGLYMTVDFNAGRNGLRGLPRAELPPFWKTFKEGFWYLIPVIVLLYCLIGLTYTPEKSAIYAIVSVIVIYLIQKKGRISPKVLVSGAEGAVRSLLVVAAACAASGIIIGTLALSSIGYKLSYQLVDIAGGHLILMCILAAATCYIMGMGVGPMGCYLALAMMVAPAMIKVGVPVLAAHLFMFYWAITSFITPPVAIAAFVAAGIAGSSPARTGFYAMRLGIGTYLVSFIFVYKPALLLMGSPLEIAIVVLASLAGITMLVAGFEGFLFAKLNWVQRIVLCAAGIVLPLATGMIQIIAAVIIAATVLWHWISLKATRPSVEIAE